MAVVQSYGQQKVRRAPLADTTLQVRPTADAYGAQLGDTLAHIGSTEFNALMDQRWQQIDQTAAIETHNQLASWRQKTLNDALQVTGKDAFDLPDTIGKQFEEYAGTVAQGLQNGRQRMQFERTKAEQQESLLSTLYAHAGRERDKYYGEQADAAVKLATSDAVANAENPSRIADELARGEGVIRERLKGQAPETVQAAVLGFQSNVHTGVISRLLDNEQTGMARAYFEAVSGHGGTAETPDYGYGQRWDESRQSYSGPPKGLGYFGPLKSGDGVVTEYSIDEEIDGKNVSMPSLVPTLTKGEVSKVLSLKDGEQLPDAIREKAVDWAKKRIADGKSPFAGPGEQSSAYPELARTATPTGKVAGPPQMTGDDIARVSKAIEVGTLRGEAQKRSDAIMAGSQSMTAALEQARSIDDPKLRDEVQTRVEHEWSIRRQAERDSAENLMVTAANQIDKGGLKAVPTTLWSQLEPGQRESLERYAKRNLQGGDGESNLVTYYDLMGQASREPEKFKDLNLLTYLGKLSKSDFKQLTGLQASIRKGDGKKTEEDLSGFRTNEQIVNDTLRTAGIDTSDSETARRAGTTASVARFKRTLDERVGALQQSTGKKATNTDVQAIADDLLAKSVDVPGWLWGHTTKKLFDIQIGDIPRATRALIEQSLTKHGVPVTDANILQTFIDSQSKGAK